MPAATPSSSASAEKYHSGSGWPSFWEAASGDAIETREDRSHGMVGVEAVCPACGGHLGHVFPDGPRPIRAMRVLEELNLGGAAPPRPADTTRGPHGLSSAIWSRQ